jgi:hypothetical protein
VEDKNCPMRSTIDALTGGVGYDENNVFIETPLLVNLFEVIPVVIKKKESCK